MFPVSGSKLIKTTRRHLKYVLDLFLIKEIWLRKKLENIFPTPRLVSTFPNQAAGTDSETDTNKLN